jgi:hypothetical protein
MTVLPAASAITCGFLADSQVTSGFPFAFRLVLEVLRWMRPNFFTLVGGRGAGIVAMRRLTAKA